MELNGKLKNMIIIKELKEQIKDIGVNVIFIIFVLSIIITFIYNVFFVKPCTTNKCAWEEAEFYREPYQTHSIPK